MVDSSCVPFYKGGAVTCQSGSKVHALYHLAVLLRITHLSAECLGQHIHVFYTSGVCTQAPCERSLVKEWQRPPGAPGNPAPHLRRFAATRSARPTEEPAPRVPGAVGGAWESDVHLEVRQLPGAKAAGLERGGLA